MGPKFKLSVLIQAQDVPDDAHWLFVTYTIMRFVDLNHT